MADSDLLVYVNATCTRGLGGGWKSVCVGLSTWRSIRWHHTPDIMTMSLERNTPHEILDEMGALVEAKLGRERVFKVETLLANPLQVARLWAGSVGATRKAALEVLHALLGLRVDGHGRGGRRPRRGDPRPGRVHRVRAAPDGVQSAMSGAGRAAAPPGEVTP